MSGAEGRSRTGDTRIFSPVLYQLSYLGKKLVLRAGIEPATPAFSRQRSTN